MYSYQAGASILQLMLPPPDRWAYWDLTTDYQDFRNFYYDNNVTITQYQ